MSMLTPASHVRKPVYRCQVVLTVHPNSITSFSNGRHRDKLRTLRCGVSSSKLLVTHSKDVKPVLYHESNDQNGRKAFRDYDLTGRRPLPDQQELKSKGDQRILVFYKVSLRRCWGAVSP